MVRLPVQPSLGNFYEAGVSKALFGAIRLDASYFGRVMSNFADDDLLLNTGVSFPIAFRRAEVTGTEVKLDVPHWKGVTGSVSYTHMRGIGELPITGGLLLGDEATTLLDEMLEAARHKILNRSVDVRRESLEKLWDAWERLKTLEPGRDKSESAGRLLDKAAAEPTFRARLEEEARALTSIGNTFMIRHTETDKIPVADSAHIDYLFHRLFSMIRLLLKSSGRSG